MDLFDHPEQLPSEVLVAIYDYEQAKLNTDTCGYKLCQQFVAELNKLGYTCDYGLDAEPFDLQKLSV